MPTDMRIYMKNRRATRRLQILEILGNKCAVCGTEENLEIDHVNSKIKSFTLSGKTLDRSWDTILNEVNKCQLLCNFHHRKKTILWLSLWQDCIKTSFYFTEKTLPGIMNLDIHASIKELTGNAAHIGKLIPLILNISRSEQLNNLKKIIQYKKESK